MIPTITSESESEPEEISIVSVTGGLWGFRGGGGGGDGAFRGGFKGDLLGDFDVDADAIGPSTSITSTSSSEISMGGLVVRDGALVDVLGLFMFMLVFEGPCT